MGRLYEPTTRIPLLVRPPDEAGAGTHVAGIVQPPDLMPSILEFMDIPVPDHVEGQSFWPLVNGDAGGHDYAFSNRYPQGTETLGGAAFDGWVGSDRAVEPGTVTDDEWAYICMPAGLPAELYHVIDDPAQEHNVIDAHPEVAERMKQAWLSFLEEHGATEARLWPFREERAHTPITPHGTLYAFRDDLGQWIAFTSRRAASEAAYHPAAPGHPREIEEITFDRLFEDNPRNLVHRYDQYYWAEDLT